MPYIGNQNALAYTSFAKQDFTTSATTSYTLDNPVTNENEIALFINFVRQEPTTAYTASGTSLTLTSATSASDDMYCVFLGKALQTVNPPSGSVGTSQLEDGAVTSAKLASGVAGVNKNFFFAYRSSTDSTQSIGNASYTKILFPTELYDTASAFASNKFTVPTGEGGYYYLQLKVRDDFVSGTSRVAAIYKNGSALIESREQNNGTTRHYTHVSGVFNLSASDYIEGFIYHDSGSSRNIDGSDTLQTSIMGYKLIT